MGHFRIMQLTGPLYVDTTISMVLMNNKQPGIINFLSAKCHRPTLKIFEIIVSSVSGIKKVLGYFYFRPNDGNGNSNKKK